MKIDYNKLQDSLEYIKTICEDAQEEGGCVECPFGAANGDCKIQRFPFRWRPRHPESDVFRVLE